MPVIVAPNPKPTPPNSDKFIQDLLATVKSQTERANEAERQAIEARGQTAEAVAARDEWKNLYLEQGKAVDKLQIALAESRSESSNLRTGLAVAANQRDLDKGFIADQQKEIKDLRRARWKYAAVGFAAGFGAGVPTGSLIAVKFNF